MEPLRLELHDVGLAFPEEGHLAWGTCGSRPRGEKRTGLPGAESSRAAPSARPTQVQVAAHLGWGRTRLCMTLCRQSFIPPLPCDS